MSKPQGANAPETPMPCPWCGGKAIVDSPGPDEELSWVYCKSEYNCCDVSGPIRKTYTAAVSAWNRVCALAEAGQRARIEGVRLGIAAAAKVCIHEGDEAAIRALDAEKIAREGEP